MQGIEVTRASAHSSFSEKMGEDGSVVAKDLEPNGTDSHQESSVSRHVNRLGDMHPSVHQFLPVYDKMRVIVTDNKTVYVGL